MHQSYQGYRRLTNAEREEVSRGLAQGRALSAIAQYLGRAPSHVAREVSRNSGKHGYWTFSPGRRADTHASSRRGGKHRLIREDRLRAYVVEKRKQR